MRCHAGRPDSIAHLQYSGILPDKGPLGMGQHALQQLSYSSGASGASMAQRAQRMEEEAMLYLSQSSSGDSARPGAPDVQMYLSHSSNDSSAHLFVHVLPPYATPGELGTPAKEQHPAEVVHMDSTCQGEPSRQLDQMQGGVKVFLWRGREAWQGRGACHSSAISSPRTGTEYRS